MGSPIDPVNYVSTLHNAAPLISKETNLQKSKQQNSERTQVRKPKSFLDLILDSTPEEVSGIDYEKRLIGLSPEEKRKAIGYLSRITR